MTYKNIPVEIVKPNQVRLEMAIQMYKSKKHISHIKNKLNQMINEQNELRAELGYKLIELTNEKKIMNALQWAEGKGLLILRSRR